MISSLILFPSGQFLPTPKQNSYYMEFLRITDTFYSGRLVIFLNKVNIFMCCHKKCKDIHLLCIAYDRDLAMLCVYLLLLHNILISFLGIFLHPSSINIREVILWLL